MFAFSEEITTGVIGKTNKTAKATESVVAYDGATIKVALKNLFQSLSEILPLCNFAIDYLFEDGIRRTLFNVLCKSHSNKCSKLARRAF